MKKIRYILLYLSIVIIIFNACSNKQGKVNSDMELAVGAKAPAFSAPGTNDEDISLSGLEGSWVVLFFYPKAFTGG